MDREKQFNEAFRRFAKLMSQVTALNKAHPSRHYMEARRLAGLLDAEIKAWKEEE